MDKRGANKADLDSSSSFGGALADMEEPCAAWLAVTSFTGRPTQVDDKRFVFKQAYKVWGFLALSDPNLKKHKVYSSFSAFLYVYLALNGTTGSNR